AAGPVSGKWPPTVTCVALMPGADAVGLPPDELELDPPESLLEPHAPSASAAVHAAASSVVVDLMTSPPPSRAARGRAIVVPRSLGAARLRRAAPPGCHRARRASCR